MSNVALTPYFPTYCITGLSRVRRRYPLLGMPRSCPLMGPPPSLSLRLICLNFYHPSFSQVLFLEYQKTKPYYPIPEDRSLLKNNELTKPDPKSSFFIRPISLVNVSFSSFRFLSLDIETSTYLSKLLPFPQPIQSLPWPPPG